MSTTKYQPKTPPDLRIPPSTHTVDVSIINTTSTIRGAKTTDFFGPHIKGHDWLAAPVFSFLIQHHGPDGTRTLLFDLGIRKDWWNSAPALVDHLRSINPPWTLDTKKSVLEILNDANNIEISTIEAIIWSHHHFDHTGDASTFPPSTALIVGPGVTKTLLPGYPDNPNSTLLKSDYANRTLIELDFTSTSPSNPKHSFPTLQISNLPAIDYFADGSFYLHTPGHAIGHICGLARVTADTNDKDSFILLAGDAFHHPGELRPSDWLTIPDTLNERYEAVNASKCPPKDQSTSTYIDGHLFARLLPQAVLGEGECKGKGDGCLGLGTFYAPSGSCACHTGTLEKRCAANVEGGEEEEVTAKWHHDPNEAARTLHKLQEFDAQDNIFVMAAHDESLLDVVDFFPARLNGLLGRDGRIRRGVGFWLILWMGWK